MSDELHPVTGPYERGYRAGWIAARQAAQQRAMVIRASAGGGVDAEAIDEVIARIAAMAVPGSRDDGRA